MKLIGAALLSAIMVGCGGAGSAPPPVVAPATSSGLVGTWTLASDDGVAVTRDSQGRPVFLSTWTFAADGSWAKNVQGDAYAGTWALDGQTLHVTAGPLAWDATVTFDASRLTIAGPGPSDDVFTR